MTARGKRPPNKGTGPYRALQALHKLEGQASAEAWFVAGAAARVAQSPDQWDSYVQSLIGAGMIFLRRGAFIITDEGLVWLGAAVAVVPRGEPQPVSPRTWAAKQQLSARHRPDLRTMRAAALDYRNIPSLHGDARVAFRTSLNAAGGDAQA